MTAAERIDEVWTLERRGGFLRRIIDVQEGAAGKKANRLGYGRLEETAELRVCAAVSGKSLAECEEGR